MVGNRTLYCGTKKYEIMTKMSLWHCNNVFLIQYNIVMFFVTFLYHDITANNNKKPF